MRNCGLTLLNRRRHSSPKHDGRMPAQAATATLVCFCFMGGACGEPASILRAVQYPTTQPENMTELIENVRVLMVAAGAEMIHGVQEFTLETNSTSSHETSFQGARFTRVSIRNGRRLAANERLYWVCDAAGGPSGLVGFWVCERRMCNVIFRPGQPGLSMDSAFEFTVIVPRGRLTRD